MIDVERARAETPGCENVVHLNNAGSALPPQPVLDATFGHLALEAQLGGYEAHEANEEVLDRFYDAAAQLLGARREEIAFCSSATRAWDMAFYGFSFAPGDRILTAVADYISNYISYIQVAKRTGAEVVTVPNDEHGQVSIDAFRELVDERVKLISITHVPTNGGLVNPAAEIGLLAKGAGIPYLLDACQSVGQLPIDVQAIGCDMLSATGRKFVRGPRGTGFLYMREELLERFEPPFLDMRAAEWSAPDRYELRPDGRRFEEWEQNYAAKAGLAAALDYALEWGVENTWPRVRELGEGLRGRLEGIGATVHDAGTERCAIVTFSLEGVPADKVKERLAKERINVTVSERAHAVIDARERKLPDLVRASPHYFNTEADLDRLVESVRIAAAC
jgi:cysteine desulfurase/selenocysteine lyase